MAAETLCLRRPSMQLQAVGTGRNCVVALRSWRSTFSPFLVSHSRRRNGLAISCKQTRSSGGGLEVGGRWSLGGFRGSG